MSEPEIHDFMAVESFSQLPFIRSSPPQISPSSTSSSTAAIRLFGIDVPHQINNSINNSSEKSTTTATSTTSAPVDPIRKFECHYCCRNFPTSQALGGHQNAHKRERQHAKRAHLHSAISAHLNQYRLPPAPPTNHHYYTNSNITSPPPRLGLGSISQPINGNPLPGLWRVPHALIHRDRSLQVPPLFRGEPASGNPNFTSSSVMNVAASSNSSSRLGYGQKKENVSLDLHL